MNASLLPIDILLVEDNEDDVLIARHAFRNVGVKVNLLVAGDGQEALEMLCRNPPHEDIPRPRLILLDFNMPRMDGREMLTIVKGEQSLRNIPVVVLTTSDAERDIQQAYDAHANAFMTKPIDFNKFREVVGKLSTYWLKEVALPLAGNLEEAADSAGP